MFNLIKPVRKISAFPIAFPVPRVDERSMCAAIALLSLPVYWRRLADICRAVFTARHRNIKRFQPQQYKNKVRSKLAQNIPNCLLCKGRMLIDVKISLNLKKRTIFAFMISIHQDENSFAHFRASKNAVFWHRALRNFASFCKVSSSLRVRTQTCNKT